MEYEELKRRITSNEKFIGIIEVKEEHILDLKEEEILDLLLLNKSLGYRIYIKVDNGWGRTLKEYFKRTYHKYRLLLN